MWATRRGRTFLGRLARDVRGNTIALVAAAMVPLVGLIGGGVDMSRIYLTKARLQQACDAGALAGRKAMGAGDWTTGTGSTNAQATDMFTANFVQGDYGTGPLTTNFTESNGVVNGTATAVVPMVLMRLFGIMSQTITVNCSAKMQIPNTDVMFVLDVTGSMNCAPGQTNCYYAAPAGTSKLDGLKSAVKCFYEALEQVNTSEVCGSDPTATASSTSAQIRFGFVPYSVNVNVGKLLPNAYLADVWKYQTRVGVYYMPDPPTGSAYDETATFNRSRDCRNWATGTDATGFPADTATPDTFTASTTTYTQVGYDRRSGQCTRRVNQSTVTYNRDDQNGTYFHTWIYKQAPINVSALKAGGSTWNNSLQLRVGNDGTDTNVSWDGCIEERQTVKNSDGVPSDEWSPIPTAAYDMNIDLVPNAAQPASYWGPALDGAVWARYTPWDTSNCNYSNGNSTSDVMTSCNLSHNFSYACPPAASKLTVYNTATNFEAYVNSLTAGGNTYHDIGMLWGARLISPTGIFASENAMTPSGRSIQRHIIFMTDGDTQTSTSNYTAYGVNWLDRRQTTYDPSNTNLDDVVNARLLALCTAIKNQNITLWVVSFGAGVSTATENRLDQCASAGHYYSASDNAALLSRFQQIASQISELRLTK